jgi:hypothetical protein
MGTRSAIGIVANDGSVKGIYCHWDGYPEYVGSVLFHYYGKKKAEQLIALGDLSSIGANIGQKHDFNMRNEYETGLGNISVSKQCTFYNRDRGEDTPWEKFDSIALFFDAFDKTGCQYFYIMKNDEWYVSNQDMSFELVSKLLNLGQVA